MEKLLKLQQEAKDAVCICLFCHHQPHTELKKAVMCAKTSSNLGSHLNTKMHEIGDAESLQEKFESELPNLLVQGQLAAQPEADGDDDAKKTKKCKQVSIMRCGTATKKSSSVAAVREAVHLFQMRFIGDEGLPDNT